MSPLEIGVLAALPVPWVETGKLFCPLICIIGNWFGSLPSALFCSILMEDSSAASAFNTLVGLTILRSSPLYAFVAPVKLPTGLLYKPVLTTTSLITLGDGASLTVTSVCP